MLGILFAVLSAVSKGFEKVTHRYILVNEDSLSYAFVWHILSSLFFLPIFIVEFKLPKQNFVWILVVISSILWAIVAYTGFKAYSYLEVSIKTPVGKSKILFVFLFSIIFLKEKMSIEKIIGTIFVFIGVVLLSYKKGKKLGNFKNKGVLLTLLSSFTMSIALIVDKYATKFFNPGMYSFLVYFLPAIILLPFVIRRKYEIKSIFKHRVGATIMTVLLGSVYYYSMLKAFKLEEASVVVPIIELNTIIAVLGGIKFLKERNEIIKKIIASVIVFIGVLLVSSVF